MKAYKTQFFDEFAEDENLSEEALKSAVKEIVDGLVDANLGGSIYKKRVALPGKGKRSSTRTIVAFKAGDKLFFIYGFAKSQKDNITPKEKKALKKLGKELLSYGDKKLANLVNEGELIEVILDEET